MIASRSAPRNERELLPRETPPRMAIALSFEFGSLTARRAVTDPRRRRRRGLDRSAGSQWRPAGGGRGGSRPEQSLPDEIAAEEHQRQRPDLPQADVDDVELFGLKPCANERAQ